MGALKPSFTPDTTHTQDFINQCRNKQLIRSEQMQSELATLFLYSSLVLLMSCQLHNEFV